MILKQNRKFKKLSIMVLRLLCLNFVLMIGKLYQKAKKIYLYGMLLKGNLLKKFHLWMPMYLIILGIVA